MERTDEATGITIKLGDEWAGVHPAGNGRIDEIWKRRRSWRERLFSLPWQPWRSHQTVMRSRVVAPGGPWSMLWGNDTISPDLSKKLRGEEE
jgi:hypothetical protein